MNRQAGCSFECHGADCKGARIVPHIHIRHIGILERLLSNRGDARSQLPALPGEVSILVLVLSSRVHFCASRSLCFGTLNQARKSHGIEQDRTKLWRRCTPATYTQRRMKVSLDVYVASSTRTIFWHTGPNSLNSWKAISPAWLALADQRRGAQGAEHQLEQRKASCLSETALSPRAGS